MQKGALPEPVEVIVARTTQLEAQLARLVKAARQVLSDIDDDGVAERHDMGVLALRQAVALAPTQCASVRCDEFAQGIVYACARLIESANQPTHAAEILHESGINVALGLEDDLVFIRQIDDFKTLPAGQ